MPAAVLDNHFDQLRDALQQGGPEAVFEQLARELVAAERYHELFDLRRLQSRLEAGLPVILTKTLDELPPDVQGRVEDRQLEACREVGGYLLGAGRMMDAWYYLRIPGERQRMAEALETFELPQNEDGDDDDELVEQLIGIAFHEGVAPRRGLQWILEHYGTCNAVTLFEQSVMNLPLSARQTCGELMVSHLHEELAASLTREIERQEGQPPDATSLWSLMADRDWLFDGEAYHVDTSHLAMVVRFARWARDPAALRQVVELCEYGQRLAPQFQYEGEEPFPDLYGDHRRFYRAQLGLDVEPAVAHFAERAASCPATEHGGLPGEIYVVLLSRLDRAAEALDACLEYLPEGVMTSGLAPTVLELARQAGAYDRLCQLSQQRGDPLSYTAGLLQAWQEAQTGQ